MYKNVAPRGPKHAQGFFINKSVGLWWKEANFVEAGHFRNYLLSRKSQDAWTSVSAAAEVVVLAATTLLKVVSHPPQLSSPTIRSINARRRPLCFSCRAVYALRITAVNLFSFLPLSLFHSHPTIMNRWNYSMPLRSVRDLFNNVIPPFSTCNLWLTKIPNWVYYNFIICNIFKKCARCFL